MEGTANIVQVRPGDSHKGRPVSDIQKPIVLRKVRTKNSPGYHGTHVVLVVVQVGRKIHMIDPDPRRLLTENQIQDINQKHRKSSTDLNPDRVSGGRQDFRYFEVPGNSKGQKLASAH